MRGCTRVTVSLDALDDETFAAMNDVSFPVARVLAGIDAAATAGLTPVKINMVVKRGINDGSIVDMAEHFRGTGHILRLIEYMDVGATNGWRMDDVVAAADIVATINQRWPVEPVKPNYSGEVASRYRYRDGAGEIGIIASVTQPFCGACTRARLSADGKLYTCLFAARRPRSAERRAPWGKRRGAREPNTGDLDTARRPLLRTPARTHQAASEDRDVLHRRLSARRSLASTPQASENRGALEAVAIVVACCTSRRRVGRRHAPQNAREKGRRDLIGSVLADDGGPQLRVGGDAADLKWLRITLVGDIGEQSACVEGFA